VNVTPLLCSDIWRSHSWTEERSTSVKRCWINPTETRMIESNLHHHFCVGVKGTLSAEAESAASHAEPHRKCMVLNRKGWAQKKIIGGAMA
jgi:hypothetical protein